VTTTHWILIGAGVALLAGIGLLFSAPTAPTVTIRTESVVVTASNQEVVVDATEVGVKAASEEVAAPTTNKTDLLLRGFVYALAGVVVSIGLSYLSRLKVLKLGGLRMVATTIASCAGVGTGITTLFKASWFWAIAGGSILFVAAYVVYQLVIKRRATAA
jgi:hypothetical protein